nr:ClassA_beta_lactamase [uncultured bacterium]
MSKTLILLAAAIISLNCSRAVSNTQQEAPKVLTSTTPSPAASSNNQRETSKLAAQVEKIAGEARGRVGAAVMLIETGEAIVSLNADQRFPMQSVYKLPIALVVLRRVDRGALALEQRVRVEQSDFISARQHSPIRDKNPRGVEMSLRDLLRFAISESDGTASDVLMRLAGGADVITRELRELGVSGVMVVNTEKELGENQSLQHQNWATPESMLVLLRALQEGRGLSVQSRILLLQLMAESTPGPRRLKGRLPPGTVVAHKTGTSGTEKGMTAATNDVGLITLPDGRHLAIAVFVSDSPADESVREGVIARIARAAWDWSTQARWVPFTSQG